MCYFLLSDGVTSAIFYMIHAILVPSNTSSALKTEEKKKVTRYSVLESRDAFIKYHATETAYQEYLIELAKMQSIPPMINIIGDVFSQEKIILNFDKISYEFFSLGKAIDVAFKAYFTFQFVYPKPCQSMWVLINQYFFEIADEARPLAANCNLMHHLKSKYSLFLFFSCCNVFLKYIPDAERQFANNQDKENIPSN